MEVEHLATLERLRQSQRQDYLKVIFILMMDELKTYNLLLLFGWRDLCPVQYRPPIV